MRLLPPSCQANTRTQVHTCHQQRSGLSAFAVDACLLYCQVETAKGRVGVGARTRPEELHEDLHDVYGF